MSKLFIRPNQVVARLRDRFAYIKNKVPAFPTVKIIAATDSDLAEYLTDSDCAQPSETTLYVGGGLSVGDEPNTAFESMVTTGVSIILAIGTADEHAKIADEIAAVVKEAVFVSLHLWNWEDNRTPLYFVTDSIIKVKGNATLLRSYEFAHEVLASYTDVDDTFGLFDNLDDFIKLKTDHEFCTAPEGDIADLDSVASFDGFDFGIIFTSGSGLDPVFVGGTSIKWKGPSGQEYTGNTPTPALDESGRWAVQMDDYAAPTELQIDSDTVFEFDNLNKLVGLQKLFAQSNELQEIDLSESVAMIDLRAQDNPDLDVDSVVDDIYANRLEIPAGGSYNIGGTCPAVSASSAAKIVELSAAPFNQTWTNN